MFLKVKSTPPHGRLVVRSTGGVGQLKYSGHKPVHRRRTCNSFDRDTSPTYESLLRE